MGVPRLEGGQRSCFQTDPLPTCTLAERSCRFQCPTPLFYFRRRRSDRHGRTRGFTGRHWRGGAQQIGDPLEGGEHALVLVGCRRRPRRAHLAPRGGCRWRAGCARGPAPTPAAWGGTATACGDPTSSWRGGAFSRREWTSTGAERVSVRSGAINASAGAGRLASTLASAARARASADFWPPGSFSATLTSVFVCLRGNHALKRRLRNGSVGIVLRRRALLVDASGRNRRGRLGAPAPRDLPRGRTRLNRGLVPRGKPR